MLKQLLALILFLALIVWVYVTIKINRSFAGVEGFSDMEPTQADNLYLKKLNSALTKMSEHMGNKQINKKQGIAPVVDTLKEFLYTKAKENNIDLNEVENSKCSKAASQLKLPARDKVSKSHKTTCRFVPSYSESLTCPEHHPDHLGAVFGSKAASGMSCNGKRITAERAKAYAIVRDGKIDRIKLIAKGTHYFKEPKVKIIGKGHGAQARAVLDNDNSIKYIRVISRGEGYHSSPNIIIGQPNGYVYCHMCCNLPKD